MWSHASPDSQGNNKWLQAYGLLTMVVVLLAFVRAFALFAGAIHVSCLSMYQRRKGKSCHLIPQVDKTGPLTCLPRLPL